MPLALASLALAAPALAEDAPCLYCTLPQSTLAANAAFAERVAKAFPRGTNVAEMKTTLGAQRFVADFWGRNRMVFRYDAGGGRNACSVVARVDWNDDGAGAVETAQGVFMQTVDCEGLALPWR